MAFNPLSLALDVQTSTIEAMSDATKKATIAPDRMETMREIEVGLTPSEVVYEENKLELLHYEAQTDEQNKVPILVVYALVNKPYILDLQPDRSVIRRLLEAGHDVYMIDWNEPSRLDQHLTLSEYVNRYIDNCVDVLRERSGQEKINLLGYCMGGTMSVMYASLHSEKVNALGLMAAGLCFDRTGGVLETWGDDEYYSPRDVVDTFGNMPADFLDDGFALMDPVDNYVTKYITFYDNMDNDAFVENFSRMERWLDEGIDLAGDAYVEFLEKIYQNNELYRNELEIGGEHVDLANVDMPILQILGEYDHLIPPEASKPFNDVVGSDDVRTIEYPTGHIGLSVSSSSHENVWPEVCDWYHEVSEAANDDSDDESSEDEVTADDDAADDNPSSAVEAIQEEAAEVVDAVDDDIEDVDGIGPTYAERLREAGIETAADLAGYEASEVADLADTTESRAAQWLAQVE